VAVPDKNYDIKRIKYHVPVPPEADFNELVNAITVTAVPPAIFNASSGDMITYKVVRNNADISTAPVYGGDTATIGAGSMTDNYKLDGGDTVSVIFNVKIGTKQATEYEVILTKDKVVSAVTPGMPYITNIIRTDTLTPLVREVENNEYDYNYYLSVDSETHHLTLGIEKSLSINDYDVYMLTLERDSNGVYVEKKTLVTNMSQIEITGLQAGDNMYVFEVSKTGLDGKLESSRYYSVKINRAAEGTTPTPAHEASLSVLNSDSNAALTAMFKPDRYEYFISLPYYVTNLSLYAESLDSNAKLRVRKSGGDYLRYDGMEVGGASFGMTGVADLRNAINQIPLDEGSNTIVITVTAEDGETKNTYVIEAFRAVPTHTGDIIHMDYTEGATMAPLWYSKMTNYFVSYPYTTTQVSFTPTLRPEELVDPTDPSNVSYIIVRDADAITRGTPNKKIYSGDTYTYDLFDGIGTDYYGDTLLYFDVYTYNGTKKVYSVTINRAYNSDRPYIETTPIQVFTDSSLMTELPMSRDFRRSENSYYLSVPNSRSNVYVKVATEGSRADSIMVNNITIGSGSSPNVLLNTGDNTIAVHVTNVDGTTERYTININRAETVNKARNSASDPDTSKKLMELTDLVVDGEILVPSFDSDEFDYIVVVDPSKTTVDMAPFFDNSIPMNVTINDMPIKTSGQKLSDATKNYVGVTGNDDPLGILNLKDGSNYYDIVLSSRVDYAGGEVEGATRVHYVLNVVKPTGVITGLDYIGTNDGSLAPWFEPETKNYYVSVPAATNNVDITVETDGATVAPYVAGYSTKATVTNTSATGTTFTFNVSNLPENKDIPVVFAVYAAAGDLYPTAAYSVTINRHTSVNPTKSIDLKALDIVAADGVTPIPLTTAFTPRDVNYYAYINPSATKVTVRATPEYSAMNVTGDGVINLNASDLTKTVIITTGDSADAKQRYSLTLIRQNTVADLTNLVYDSVTDSAPNADNRTYTYTTLTTPFPIDVTSSSMSTDVIRINGKRVDATTGHIDELIATEREKYDIRVTSATGESMVTTLFANKDKNLAIESYEPVITDIMVRDQSTATLGTFDVTFDPDIRTYNVLVDTSTIELYAYSNIGTMPDTSVTIEMFDEDLNDYVIIPGTTPLITKTIGSSDMATYKFRATKMAESGFENITEYVINVYKSSDPILTDVIVEPDPKVTTPPQPRAVLAETFNGTKTGMYHIYLDADATEFDILGKSFSNVNVQIARESAWGADDINWTTVPGSLGTRTETITSPLSEDEFMVQIRISYDKVLPGGGVDTRYAVYNFHVIRSPYNHSDVYLGGLDIVEEDDPDNNQYRRDNAVNAPVPFKETQRIYHTWIDYRDRTVGITIDKKNISDIVTAKIVGTTMSPIVMNDGVSETFELPVTYLLADNNVAEIEFTVFNGTDYGYYKVYVHRGDRRDDTDLTGDPRLSDLITVPTLSNPTAFVVGDDTAFRYKVITDPSTTSINIHTEPNTWADTIIIRHYRPSDPMNEFSGNMLLETGHKKDFDLNTEEDVNVFFITTSNSANPSVEFTYVLEVYRQNTENFADIRITDTPEISTPYNYYEMDPAYSAPVTTYEAHVKVLDQELSFEALAPIDPTAVITVKQDGVLLDTTNTAAYTKVAPTATVAAQDNFTARLNLAKEVTEFEFTIQTSSGIGIYKVKVIRDRDGVSTPSLQTRILGQVVTLAQDDEAKIDLYGFNDYSINGDAAMVVSTVNTAVGDLGKFEFKFNPTALPAGTYTMVVRRVGYLNYYIEEIEVQDSYAPAKYDFGKIYMVAGDIKTIGTSKDVIDKEDLVYFNKLKNNDPVVPSELYDASSPLPMMSIVNEPEIKDKEIEETEEVKEVEEKEKVEEKPETTEPEAQTDPKTSEDTNVEPETTKPEDETAKETETGSSDKTTESDSTTDPKQADTTLDDKKSDSTKTDESEKEETTPAETSDNKETDTSTDTSESPKTTENDSTSAEESTSGESKTPADEDKDDKSSSASDKKDSDNTSETPGASEVSGSDTAASSSSSASSESGSTSDTPAASSESGSTSSTPAASSESGSSTASAGSSSSDSGSSSASASSSSSSSGSSTASAGSSSSSSSSSSDSGSSSIVKLVMAAYEDENVTYIATEPVVTTVEESKPETTEPKTTEPETTEPETTETVATESAETTTAVEGTTETEATGTEETAEDKEATEEIQPAEESEAVETTTEEKETTEEESVRTIEKTLPLMSIPTMSGTVVNRMIIDFNEDGVIDTKDMLYIGSHVGMTAPKINNITSANRTLIKADI
jgi:hypothetical protein